MQVVRTVNEALLKLSARGEKPAWRWLDAQGQWQTITAKQAYGLVHALADRLTTHWLSDAE